MDELDPAAIAERAVLGDDLQQRGEPIGELIGLQQALAGLPADAPPLRRRAIERSVAAVLDRHHAALYGELAPRVNRLSAPDLFDPVLAVTRWCAGFADAIWLQTTRGDAPGLADVYRAMRPLPIARFVRRLELGVGNYPAAIAAITGERVPTLRSLVIGDHRRWLPQLARVDLPSTAAVTELAHHLDELRIDVSTHFEPVDSPRLRVLGLWAPWRLSDGTEAYPRFTGALPRLETLQLTSFQLDGGLCERFATVTEAKLASCRMDPGWLDRLVESPWLGRLRVLDLSYTVRAEDLEDFARVAGRLAGIEKVLLAASTYLPDTLRAVRPRLPANVVFTK